MEEMPVRYCSCLIQTMNSQWLHRDFFYIVVLLNRKIQSYIFWIWFLLLTKLAKKIKPTKISLVNLSWYTVPVLPWWWKLSQGKLKIHLSNKKKRIRTNQAGKEGLVSERQMRDRKKILWSMWMISDSAQDWPWLDTQTERGNDILHYGSILCQ